MSKPKLLDLFCCAGGAGEGYARAGFNVVGVDIRPRPNYPYKFFQADAIDFVNEFGFIFDAIHASPPCQSRTTMSNRYPEAQAAHPQLIEPTRAAILETGKPYVIENVPGAKKDLINPVTLSGGMFGLGVHRPRLFETNFPLVAPPKKKPEWSVGVYGRSPDGRRLWTRADGTIYRAARGLEEGSRAMGIDWMEWHELTESIPPAMTEHIGKQLMEHIGVTA